MKVSVNVLLFGILVLTGAISQASDNSCEKKQLLAELEIGDNTVTILEGSEDTVFVEIYEGDETSPATSFGMASERLDNYASYEAIANHFLKKSETPLKSAADSICWPNRETCSERGFWYCFGSKYYRCVRCYPGPTLYRHECLM